MVMWRRTARGRVSAQNLLVPQGGFEPSTYRLRSDCSAVELLRRPEGLLPNFYQTSCPQLKRRHLSVRPRPRFRGGELQRGTQSRPTHFPVRPRESGDPEVLDSRLRGNERWKALGRRQPTTA